MLRCWAKARLSTSIRSENQSISADRRLLANQRRFVDVYGSAASRVPVQLPDFVDAGQQFPSVPFAPAARRAARMIQVVPKPDITRWSGQGRWDRGGRVHYGLSPTPRSPGVLSF